MHHDSLGPMWVDFVAKQGWSLDTDFMAASSLAATLFLKHDISYVTALNVQRIRVTPVGLAVTVLPCGKAISVTVPKAAYASGDSNDRFMTALILGGTSPD